MPQTNGLYRICCGARPVPCFYDYETGIIGPYSVPIKIQYKYNDASRNTLQVYRLYSALLKDDNAIAVFNNCNNTIVVVCPNKMYTVPVVDKPTKKEEKALREFTFDKTIELPQYRHIGYIKTYPKCKAVYEYPWKLIQCISDGSIVDYQNNTLEGTPLENPPYSLYKELINTEHDAVYFDLDTAQIKYLDRKEK